MHSIQTTPTTADFIIIGAGIVGLSIARALKQRDKTSKIIILEKESHCGEHASGRNSGVLHAGFYYTADSLKAKLTREGNQRWTAYCLEHHLPIRRCGKLVVARNPTELTGLHTLLERGKQNKIKLELISAQDALAIEPRIKTYEQALFSETTASVSPQAILTQLLKELSEQKVLIHYNTRVINYKNHRLQTNRGQYEACYLINAAGLYADHIAKQFGFSQTYSILPFKGLYLYASHESEKLNTHVYPVPNLENPFLGVHFTITVDGKIKMGPTAIPAFWREQYHGFSRFKGREMLDIVTQELRLLIDAKFNFRRLAIQELMKYNRAILTQQAAQLVSEVHKHHYQLWGKPGIRAQLLNTKTRCLEMDFIVEYDNRSMHILNAVSPAFTCALPFAEYIVNRIPQ